MNIALKTKERPVDLAVLRDCTTDGVDLTADEIWPGYEKTSEVPGVGGAMQKLRPEYLLDHSSGVLDATKNVRAGELEVRPPSDKRRDRGGRTNVPAASKATNTK